MADRYLLTWADPIMEVAEGETPASITKQEVERLARLAAIARAAQAVPRRLGSDASDGELNFDKKRCRRVVHVADQLVTAWGGKAPSITGVEREAAVVKWETWWKEHEVWLINRRRYIATFSQKPAVDERWCKSAIVKINNELHWLGHALRD